MRCDAQVLAAVGSGKSSKVNYAMATRMKANPGFSDELLAILHEGKGLRIRAGTGPHRFIGIWVVVVKNRVFVRSWSVKPGGWYRTFLKEPRGAIQIGNQEIAVRAVSTRNERLRPRSGARIIHFAGAGPKAVAGLFGPVSMRRLSIGACSSTRESTSKN